MADEVHLLSDEELRSKLRYYNLRHGPITRTTRKMFEQKLERAIRGSEARFTETDDRQSETENSQATNNFCPTAVAGNSSCTRTCTKKESSESPEVTGDEAVHGDGVNDDAKKESISTFYAVCLQSDETSESKPQTPLVFTDKSQALLSAKKNSGARFKAFNTRNEAEAFAYGSQVTPSRKQRSPVYAAPVDPIAKFKAPKPGEIVQFRKLVETGKVDKLSEMFYSNPKYLISSGDTPVILQEGFRYNAMHVAAKAGKKEVCQLLVDTLEDEEFWDLIYPSSTCNSIKDQDVSNRRKRFILDLYLNTPDRSDKGLAETPLHFACKYGKADVVEYLLSCPGIHRDPKNKDGETPQQVICSRATDCHKDVRARIEKMFTEEETVFVPILRAEDNCSFPKLGNPSPDLFNSNYTEDGSSPEDPRYKISAYAGPMSPQQADTFRFVLKSPHATPEEKAKFRNIKRSDSEKGLERIARKVAKSRNVGWCEYWKFLDKFTDLSTEDGLKMLEEHLGRKKTMSTSNSPLNTSDCVFDEKIESPDQLKGTATAEQSHTPTGRQPHFKTIRNRLNYDDPAECYARSKDMKAFSGTNGHVPCANGLQAMDKKLPTAMQDDDEEFPVSTRILNFDDEQDKFDISNCSEDSLGDLTTDFARLRLSSNTSCSETKNNESCDKPSEDNITDPVRNSHLADRNTEIPLFIEGFQPSKVDVDVLRAIKSVKINADVFPNISRWQKLVRSFSKNDRQGWPGPGSPRFHQFRKGISKTWSC